MGRGETGLLDWLRRQVACDFLSDLPGLIACAEGRRLLHRVLDGARPEAWPQEEWGALLRYLTGTHPGTQTSAQIRKTLLRHTQP